MFKVAPSKWANFEQREILWLEKFTSKFSVRIGKLCHMDKSDRCFCISLDMLGEINFNQNRSKLRLKASNYLFENCRKRKKKKEGRRLFGHLENLGDGEQKLSVTDLKHKHLVPRLLWTLFSELLWEKVWLINVVPLFNVAQLACTLEFNQRSTCYAKAVVATMISSKEKAIEGEYER